VTAARFCEECLTSEKPAYAWYRRENVMTLLSQELRPVDLRDVPLDRIATLGDSPLAHCFALYHQRLEADTLLLSAFNSNI
jgi:hypothetical protein